jgi:hypothetical protein
MLERPILLTPSQFSTGDMRHADRVLFDALVDFEHDMRPQDPKLANDIAAYRNAGNMDIFQRIIDLTDIGSYQRALLAMVLQTGIDVTSDPNFSYILRQPTLSGNTKARHLILMAVAMNPYAGQVA